MAGQGLSSRYTERRSCRPGHPDLLGGVEGWGEMGCLLCILEVVRPWGAGGLLDPPPGVSSFCPHSELKVLGGWAWRPVLALSVLPEQGQEVAQGWSCWGS